MDKKLTFDDKFDMSDIYDSMIKPKIEDLIMTCRKNDIPVYISVCTKNEDSGTEYKRSIVTPREAGRNNLVADEIAECVKLARGYKTFLPQKTIVNGKAVPVDDYLLISQIAAETQSQEPEPVEIETVKSDLPEKTTKKAYKAKERP